MEEVGIPEAATLLSCRLEVSLTRMPSHRGMAMEDTTRDSPLLLLRSESSILTS